MKQPLFYHIRPSKKGPVLPHTYAIKKVGDAFVVGFAITHENDQFCKKTGRALAEKKMNILAEIKDENFRTFKDKDGNTGIPLTIAMTLGGVLQRSGELLNHVGKIKVKFFTTRFEKRIPFVHEYEIKPPMPEVTSEDIMGKF